MNAKFLFDQLLYLITTLKSENIHQYFNSVGFTFSDYSPKGLFFLAESTGHYQNVYHIEVNENKIEGCYYLTTQDLDLEALIEYATGKCEFSLITYNNEDNVTLLKRGHLKCYLRKRKNDNGITYRIRLFKSFETEAESVVSAYLNKPN